MATIHFDSPIKRTLLDGIPIIFDWPRAGVSPQVSVAFDNTTFSSIEGSVVELSPGKYRVEYNVADRPVTPSLISYKVEEGGDEGVFEVLVLNPNTVTTPTETEYSNYGPKRVRTKELDIEQFSPSEIAKLEERKNAVPPNFCSLPFCIGVPR